MAMRRDLIDPSVAVHHGRIVKPAGDGSVIESAAWSMRCAAPCRPSRPPSPQPPQPRLLHDANRLAGTAAAIERRQTDRDCSRRLPAALKQSSWARQPEPS
jgi:hypothetical protein